VELLEIECTLFGKQMEKEKNSRKEQKEQNCLS
jgi:hypothetical protein